uniref:Uncharacterized protein n=1 Tax=Arundo donax TaxID=35708 RepID=A0A0A8Z9D0_ARUDO
MVALPATHIVYKTSSFIFDIKKKIPVKRYSGKLAATKTNGQHITGKNVGISPFQGKDHSIWMH